MGRPLPKINSKRWSRKIAIDFKKSTPKLKKNSNRNDFVKDFMIVAVKAERKPVHESISRRMEKER